MKTSPGHASHAGRQRHKSADHREKPTYEYGQVSPAGEESVGPVEFATAHQNPVAIALDQRAATVAADLVRHKRPNIAPDRARRSHPEQLHRAFKDEVAGERHDQFRRERDASRLDPHQNYNTAVTAPRHERFDEDEENRKNLFSHGELRAPSSER